jgi:alkylhydroperoxidase family enzyme
MALVPFLDRQDMKPEDRDALVRDINLYRALAHSPGAARKFSGLGSHIRHDSKLDPRLRELAILQVGYLTRSSYEYSHHIKIARDFGVSDDDIRAMIAETNGRGSDLEPLTKSVLLAAREMTLDLAASEETIQALKTGMDLECLTDLILTIAFYNCVVRYLETMQVDVEDDYLPYLEEFPLPEAPHAERN